MFASSFARTLVTTAGAALFASICLTAAAAPAAATTVVSVSKTVSYSGLDLNSVRGRAILDARIKSAAKSICETNSNDLRSRLHSMRCVRDAIAQASRS